MQISKNKGGGVVKSRKKPMNIPKKPIILLHFERRIYGRNLKEIGQPSSAAPAWFSLTTLWHSNNFILTWMTRNQRVIDSFYQDS